MLTVDKLRVGDLIRREHSNGSYIIRRVTSVGQISAVAVVVEATGSYEGADHRRTFSDAVLPQYTIFSNTSYRTNSLNYMADDNLSDEDKKVIKEAINGCN